MTPEEKKAKNEKNAERERARSKRRACCLYPDQNIPRITPFRYFAHFVLCFREANEMTPEENKAKNEKNAERERARSKK